MHWAQNSLENRFQLYAPDYNAGKTKAELIDLTNITDVPVSLWSGLLDETCANAQARITVATIGERATLVTVPWASHTWWGGGSLTNGLYKELEAHLIDPEIRPYPHDNTTEVFTN